MTPSPRLNPGAAPTRSRPAQTGRRWWLAGSVLLHGAVLALLLVLNRPRQQTIEPEPSYELVFAGGGTPDRSTSEQRGPEQPPAVPAPDASPPTPPDSASEAPPPQPAPPEPPVPDAAPFEPVPELVPEPVPPEPAPTPTEPPTPLPAQPEPTQPEPAQPEPAPSAPAAAEPDPEPEPAPVPAPEPPPRPDAPAVRLTAPEPLPPPLSPQSMAPDLSLTVPPIPPAASPSAAPPPAQRQAQRRPAPDPLRFPPPIDLNYGRAASRVPPAPRGSVASRAIDLSLGAPKPGPNKSEAFFDARAAKLGADWASGLAAYWRQHRFYPRQAAEHGEDGTVQVELVVNRLGKVESVEIRSRSGSPWLDMAALSTWRGAQLAPFPAENTEPRITMTLTINYVLVR